MHRKTITHFHEPGHLHEFTFSCYRRQPLLLDDHRCVSLAEAIDSANLVEQFDLVAYVFMPDHVHLLVYPRPEVPRLSTYPARVKRSSSAAIKNQLEADGSPLLQELATRERPGKECFRFWQEGPGYDRNLWTPDAVQAAITDIHNNPVRRGLCRSPQEWKWSSIHFYDSPGAMPFWVPCFPPREACRSSVGRPTIPSGTLAGFSAFENACRGGKSSRVGFAHRP